MTEWAIHVWPYVNGKALMSGLDLKEMEASEFLDVVHFLFEDDNTFVSEEAFAAKSRLRTVIFKDMYNTKYKYEYVPEKPRRVGTGTPENYPTDEEMWGAIEEDDVEGIMQPFNPRERKPDLPPPTEFDIDSDNPFPGLEAPMR